MLSLQCFGSPKYSIDGKEIVGFASRKAEALLIYLACTRRVHARESLATLLWDDRSHEQSLANLSVLLSSLRKNVGDYLAITRHDVGLLGNAEIEVDTRRFEAKLSVPNPTIEALQEVVALYSDDFLLGFSLRDASGFEDWLFIERERLQRSMIGALERLAHLFLQPNDLNTAISTAQRLLAIDPLHEPGYRLLMEALAKNDQRNAALDAYQNCKRTLQEELDVTPSAETTALYEMIRNNGFAAAEAHPQLGYANQAVSQTPVSLPPSRSTTQQQPHPNHNLPKLLNTFIGRQNELGELASLLDDESYRLVSLVGPGGNGKTRLAIEAATQAAEEQTERFADGVWLVELDALTTADQLLNTLADVLDYRFVDGQRRLQELLAYLQQRKLLLLFDNFEHILDAAETVQKLLHHAPGLTALITSRERLNLAGETVLEINGLNVPSAEDKNDSALDRFSAIQLFIDRAQRSDATFRLTPSETAHVVQICQQLEGVPLAIELAAAWVRSLSCGEIAAEISQSIDFLESMNRGIPQRHSSLRAVFEHSWRLLNPAEQRTLAQLSVFRGGFTREAATAITDTSLRTLVALHDKSLVRRQSGNRYSFHPLVGQLSQEKLVEMEGVKEICQSRHARYFANFLYQRKDDLERSRQLDALAEMDAERENLRSAYHHALEQADLDAIDLAMEAFLAYLDVRCYGIEAMNTAERTEQILKPLAQAGDRQAHYLWGVALVHHAMFRSFEYDNERAVDLAKQALTILQAHDDQAGIALSHNSLGLAQMQRGEMENALVNFEEAAELRKSLGKDALVASSMINIAQIAWRRGEYRKAEAVCQTALLHAQKSENPWRIAMVFNVMGILAKELEQYDQAREYLQRSVEAYQAVGNRWGISSIISESGVIAFLQKKYSLARSHFEQSIAIRRDLGNVIDRAGDMLWLGKVAEAQEQIDEAEEQYQMAAQLLKAVNEPINKSSAIFLLAKLRFKRGRQGVNDTLEQFQLALQLAQASDSQPLLQQIREEIEKVNQWESESVGE